MYGYKVSRGYCKLSLVALSPIWSRSIRQCSLKSESDKSINGIGRYLPLSDSFADLGSIDGALLQSSAACGKLRI